MLDKQTESGYKKYLENHIKNVKRAYYWLKENCKEIFKYIKDENAFEKQINKHDESKWSDEEFEAYAEHFYGKTKDLKYDPVFEKAWEHHYLNNSHHPEYYNGKDMSNEDILEMICDWWTFSFNKNNLNEIFDYYENNAKDDKDKNLSKNTKKIIEEMLALIKEALHKDDVGYELIYNKNFIIQKQFGVISDDCRYNDVVVIDNRNCRNRVTCIVMNGTKVFLAKDKNNDFTMPGGSVEKDKEPIVQAEHEVNEETHMKVKNIKDTKVDFLEKHNDVMSWVKEHVKNPNDRWIDYYTKLFIGEYDGKYNGKVKKEDEDPTIELGQFYEYDEVKNDKTFIEPWKIAIEAYLKSKNKKPDTKQTIIKKSIDESLIVTCEKQDNGLEKDEEIPEFITNEQKLYEKRLKHLSEHNVNKETAENICKFLKNTKDKVGI